jgi:hypothetical protein
MSKKQKVEVRRPGDFEEVDQELAEAMAMLDEANTRVGQLLDGQESLPGLAEDVVSDASEDEDTREAGVPDSPA